MTLGTAIAVLEYDSIADGVVVGDAMVKRAALDVLHAGTVHPGRYLLLVGGSVAEVEEAVAAATDIARPGDLMFLADPHPRLAVGLGGAEDPAGDEALGVVETTRVPAAIRAADAGLKAAPVSLWRIEIADDLGGKGYLLLGGTLADVQASVEAAAGAARAELVATRVVALLHPEMAARLRAGGRFAAGLREG